MSEQRLYPAQKGRMTLVEKLFGMHWTIIVLLAVVVHRQRVGDVTVDRRVTVSRYHLTYWSTFNNMTASNCN